MSTEESRDDVQDTVVYLPRRLPVTTECLGATVIADLPGHRMSLTLPVAHDERLTAPPGNSGQSLAIELRHAARTRWGYRTRPDVYYVEAVRASFVAEFGEADNQLSTLTQLTDDFRAWFALANEWFAIWTGQPVSSPDSSEQRILHMAIPGRGLMGIGGGRSSFAIGDIAGLGLSQIQGAFQRASVGTRLPIEYRMLLSSQIEQLRGDVRRSVIDAGTAAEVALASAIRANLDGSVISPDFVDRVIVNSNGLVGLIDLASSAGIDCQVSKRRAADQLARVRNEAAHAGHVPTPAEARTACVIARELVQAVRPLPAQ